MTFLDDFFAAAFFAAGFDLALAFFVAIVSAPNSISCAARFAD
jgi:hypothetical protein